MSTTVRRQPTVAEMQAALDKTKQSPQDHFARMVRIGLINSRGQVTRLFGGEAEPEAYAQRPTSTPTNGVR